MTTKLRLPAATSESVKVPLDTWDTDPSAATWQAAVSATKQTLESGAPSSWTAATLANRGTSAAPDWRIVVPIDGLAAGVYGLWIKRVGSVGTSPVRFAGTVTLY